MTPAFLGTVSDGGKLLLTPATRGLLMKHLATLTRKPVVVTVAVHTPKRSDRASRYYFGVVVPLIAEHCGYDKQEMHELLAMRFLRMADDPVTGSPRRQRTPETDSKAFADYVDACIRFASELGIYVPQPGEVVA